MTSSLVVRARPPYFRVAMSMPDATPPQKNSCCTVYHLSEISILGWHSLPAEGTPTGQSVVLRLWVHPQSTPQLRLHLRMLCGRGTQVGLRLLCRPLFIRS